MSVSSYDELQLHEGHDIECVTYANGRNASLECLTCNEMLIDFDSDSTPVVYKPFSASEILDHLDDDGFLEAIVPIEIQDVMLLTPFEIVSKLCFSLVGKIRLLDVSHDFVRSEGNELLFSLRGRPNI